MVSVCKSTFWITQHGAVGELVEREKKEKRTTTTDNYLNLLLCIILCGVNCEELVTGDK